MTDRPHLLAIDQGTTSSRAILFNASAEIVATAQRGLTQIYPRDGWVEQDPEQLWQATLAACRTVFADDPERAQSVVAIGIANQRETTLVWDRATSKPLGNAIGWQDRRTAGLCDRLRREGHEPLVTQKTGLVLDPYFSATKIAWILDNIDGARAAADRGELAFGTVDSYLLWRTTGGRLHATDATNASRTMLFDIRTQQWDDDLLALFRIPRSLLPEVFDCAHDFGHTDAALLGRPIAITGVIGDQQAAAIGQGCTAPGMIKSTYGTGCFLLLNTGPEIVPSRHRLLSTVAYRLQGQPSYALEGSIFVAGAAVQWLRDGISVIATAGQTESMASGLSGNGGVYLVPAFVGLGAPHWDPHARGALFGITRDTGPAHLARAALESAAFQTHDLLQAMRRDGVRLRTLRVDGGMVRNDWLIQFLADIVDLPVERPAITETSALGAAFCAGLQSGLFESLDATRDHWRRQARFTPSMAAGARAELLAGWQRSVDRVRSQ
ncbi:MAG: glycerol kinase [Chloroflexi bacterium]|nr:MAG: glycerol kinase [Chloroflexota bacterium]